MPDEDQLFFLRPADPPSPKRQTNAELIMARLAELPSRRELAKYAFVFLCVGAVLGIVATEAFWRYLPACSAP
jgi:hypothetical protein